MWSNSTITVKLLFIYIYKSQIPLPLTHSLITKSQKTLNWLQWNLEHTFLLDRKCSLKRILKNLVGFIFWPLKHLFYQDLQYFFSYTDQRITMKFGTQLSLGSHKLAKKCYEKIITTVNSGFDALCLYNYCTCKVKASVWMNNFFNRWQ